ncbi:hypothetical protein QTP86_018806 [Hemibagrus guttatus]|nr:hypothetical protein QTP86_018806 [Hemibagrus guttatus]
MPILLFLIDTSASMNQRTYLGTTYLDIAKGAVEIFMKLRARDPASRGDRYMLVTFDDPPYGVKAGWKENHATFMSELKNLQAYGLTTLGNALRTAFDLLNLNRLVSGIDNYGQGRNPFFLEPSVIITITDGNKLTHSSGVPDELHLPLNSPLPGSELTKEPFRWDQRLFALVLRMPGAAVPDTEQLGSVPSDESAITQMCEVTGGDEEVMGKFAVKGRNLEGQMVVDFAKRMDMAVVNTFFHKREEHRVTYKSGGRRTQTKSSKIEKKTKWWKLKKEECCEEFRQKLRQTLGGQVVLPDDWETTAEVIRETGRKVLGVSSGRRKEDKETWWWNEEVHDSIQRKRLAKKKWDMDRTEENRQEYKELQRRVKREVSKAKQKAYDELYMRLDTREGERDLYRLARQRDRDGKDVQQVRVIKDRDGRVLASEESVQRRWKEYFEELINEENEREKRVEGVNSVEQKVDKIRKDEVRKALKRMKSGKAVGPDDIPVEVWKCLGEEAVDFLTSLFNRVLENEKMPEEWRRSVLVPIFKNKGDVQSCSNYRGIKLMSHTMKLWERVVEARLRKVVEICEQQYGFMPRKITTDARLDRIRNEYIRGTAHVGRLGDKVREARLRWFGHVQRRESRSYCVRTQRMLNQCLESLVQKVLSGVVINFEKTGPDPPPVGEDGLVDPVRPLSSFSSQPWHSCHKLIYVRPNPKTGVPVGHWPIPESFWPDQNSPTLPPRSSHPVVRFSCVDCEPMVIDKLPFDKYELEPSPLTQYILERKSPHMCWQVFVSCSGKHSDVLHPFGYLKASTTLTCVNLFVMPYNYPVLLPLLDDLFKVHKLKPNLKWRQAFEVYLKSMPPYFLLPLKKALRMMGAPNLISDNMDCGLSYSVISYLKKLSQQAKIESDRMIVSVGKKPPQETGIKVKNHSSTLSLAHRRDFKQLLQGITGEVPLRLNDINLKEFAGFQIALLNKDVKPQAYRNAYDIPRRNLLDHVTRMRSNLLRTTQKLIRSQDEDYLHSIPVGQMGNYQEYLKMMPPPLREIDPDQPKRLHTFGNPFKQDKKGMMIDEADEFVTGPQNKKRGNTTESNSGTAPKRRRSMSPLLRRPQTPPIISNHVLGKGTTVVPGQHGLIKPIPLHKGVEGNSTVGAESNGERVTSGETGDSWSGGVEGVGGGTVALSLEEKGGMKVTDGGEERVLLENRVGEECMEERPPERPQNCENPSPPEQDRDMEGAGGDTSTRPTIVMVPLEGSNAELRTRVIKEVRKPGRNYESIFRLLEEVKGPVSVQRYFIHHAIKEAARFKKRVLIQQLESALEEIEERQMLHAQVNNVHGR